MKEYPFLEAIGTADEKFLEEVFEDNIEHERRQDFMSKKKIVTIMIAAALIVAMGVTAVAAGVSKIRMLGNYFEGNKERLHIPDEVPIMQNPEDYANEVTQSADTAQTAPVKGAIKDAGAIDNYTPPAPGEAKITAVSATKRSLVMTIEFNASGLGIPQELPEDALSDEGYSFEWPENNCMGGASRFGPISRDGDIITFIYTCDTGFGLPEDELVVTLHKFGYFARDSLNKGFKTIKDIDVEVRLPVSEINFMETLTAANTGKLMDADFTVELSPYELCVYSDSDNLIAAGHDLKDMNKWNATVSDYFMKDCNIEFHLLDGTSFTEGIAVRDRYTCLITHGSIVANESISGAEYSFEVPLDISQVDYIIIKDVRFDFAASSADLAQRNIRATD